ncbi:hypothetical protein GCM10019814_09570 [Lactococcus raffinolactis]
MRIKPIAIGIDVVPIDRLLIVVATLGTKYPKATPIPIATKIYNVR